MRFGFRFKNLCLGTSSRATEAFWNELARCFAGCRVIQIEGVQSHMIQCSEDTNPNHRIHEIILKRARCIARCIDLIPNEYEIFYAEIPNKVTHLMGWDLKAEATSKQFYLHGIPMSLSLFVDRCNTTRAPVFISIPMHAKAAAASEAEAAVDRGFDIGSSSVVTTDDDERSMLVEEKQKFETAIDETGSFYSFHDGTHRAVRHSPGFLHDIKSQFTKTENGVRYVRKIQLDVKIILILDNHKVIEFISVPLEMDYWGHECCPAVYWDRELQNWTHLTDIEDGSSKQHAWISQQHVLVRSVFGVKIVSDKW
eukprot:CAMPEP_0185281148 /NCGR_PEP_ID=MMETSP1359-20130426/66557_1 /TAXON_ID=552665 /ORGANISM="Bigelowiella longifila, Strain CCMP242" /LENGTH=310 /DNA_ID=CAMNT_0027876547 /DNA_START=506 /DNA_END=1435 /DNA_ORIENTATION=-